MEKSIRYISTLFLAMSFVLVSCQKETGANISTGDDSAFAGKTLSLDSEQRQHAAQMLAMSLANHPDAYAQLNDVIAMVRSYGVDENIYVYDILHREHSKFIPAHLEIEELVNAINEAELLANCGVENRSYLGNLQLYWPYHDDWDRVTPPVVVFAPEVISIPMVTGFEITDFHPGELIHNIEDLVRGVEIDVHKMDYDENSYIVIKEAEFPYTYYPRFVDGEFTKDDITWIRPTDVIGMTGDWCYVDHVVGQDTLVKASAIGFQSSGVQHDYFWAGGSEFALTMAHMKEDGTQTPYTRTFEMSRKDISTNRQIQFDPGFIFHFDWTRDDSEVYYRLYERDAGGSSFTFNINLSIGGSSVSMSLTGNSSDDEIATGYLGRDDYMNSCRSGQNAYDFSDEKVYFKAELYGPSSF